MYWIYCFVGNSIISDKRLTLIYTKVLIFQMFDASLLAALGALYSMILKGCRALSE